MPASWTCCRRDCTCPSSTFPVERMSSSGKTLSKSSKSVAQVLQTCLPNHCHHTLFWLLRISFSSQKMSEAKHPRLASRNCNCPLTSQGHKVITRHAINLWSVAWWLLRCSEICPNGCPPSCLAFALEANSCFFQQQGGNAKVTMTSLPINMSNFIGTFTWWILKFDPTDHFVGLIFLEHLETTLAVQTQRRIMGPTDWGEARSS